MSVLTIGEIKISGQIWEIHFNWMKENLHLKVGVFQLKKGVI